MEETAEASKGGGPHRTAPHREGSGGVPLPLPPPPPPPFCSCWSFFVLFFVPFQRR